MEAQTKRKLGFVAGFAVYFSALWLLWETPVVYPLKIFVVLLHEISHGAVAIATGGAIERIVLDPNQGGACLCSGNPFLTLSAGYLGSLGWGMLLTSAGTAKKINARIVTGLVGLAVVGLTVAYVRGPFGIGFGLAFGAALILAARKLPALWNQRLLLTLGLTSCLYAILDIKSDVLDRPEIRSDAAVLGEMLGVPTLAVGFTWIALAVAFSAWLVARAYRDA